MSWLQDLANRSKNASLMASGSRLLSAFPAVTRQLDSATMSETLVINEIYLSLQGESTFAGLPCVFVRLTACNLRCSYCDTAYAFAEGKKMSLGEARAEVHRLSTPFPQSGQIGARTARNDASHPQSKISNLKSEIPARRPLRLPLVELTGGEPLLQPHLLPLMKMLCDDGFTVLVETSGALDISQVDPRVRRIMDLKCPSSGEVDRNRWENLAHLRDTDEIKFVIGTHEDYAWATQRITEHNLENICPLLLSWVHPLEPGQRHTSLKRVPAGQTPIARKELVEQIIADALPVRFQLQMHKIIWSPDQRGV
jgi:7-carboxy-7-deazaguanine synthase